jgi:hypothetical protein
VPPTEHIAGEPCVDDSECGAHLQCSFRELCGADVGAACTTDVQCLSDVCLSGGFCGAAHCRSVPSRCDDGGDNAHIKACCGGPCATTCEPLAARGEVCRDHEAGDACTFDRVCELDLVCAVQSFSDDGIAMCAPPNGRNAGEVCAAPPECASGDCDLVAELCR